MLRPFLSCGSVSRRMWIAIKLRFVSPIIKWFRSNLHLVRVRWWNGPKSSANTIKLFKIPFVTFRSNSTCVVAVSTNSTVCPDLRNSICEDLSTIQPWAIIVIVVVSVIVVLGAGLGGFLLYRHIGSRVSANFIDKVESWTKIQHNSYKYFEQVTIDEAASARRSTATAWAKTPLIGRGLLRLVFEECRYFWSMIWSYHSLPFMVQSRTWSSVCFGVSRIRVWN